MFPSRTRNISFPSLMHADGSVRQGFAGIGSLPFGPPVSTTFDHDPRPDSTQIEAIQAALQATVEELEHTVRSVPIKHRIIAHRLLDKQADIRKRSYGKCSLLQ